MSLLIKVLHRLLLLLLILEVHLTTPANNWLTLQNGTLIYRRTNPGTDFTISTTTAFAIPATAGLYVDLPSNTANRNVLIGAAAK